MTRDPRVRQPLPSLLCLALLIGLGGCGSAPEQPAPDTQTAPVEMPGAKPETPPPPAAPPSPHAALHARVESLLLADEWPQAQLALRQLPDALPAPEQAWRDYYLGWSKWLQGEVVDAASILDHAATAATTPRLQQRISNLARQIATRRGEHLKAAQLAAAQLELTRSPERRLALMRETWRSLLRIPAQDRQQAEAAATGHWRGWLSLAALDRPDRSGQALQEDLTAWLAQHPQHPAAAALPGGLGFLLQPHAGPRQVALLLPLSGELAAAARAIRNGYLAQHYLATTEGGTATLIRIIDTGDVKDVESAYRQAVAGGAELVIGPLDRGAVDRLAGLSQRPVPVIALNRASEPPNQVGAAFLQLSLAPEDEMQQLAAQAFGSGARRALLVRAAGERGARLSEALTAAWRAEGGVLADTLTYSSPEAWSEGLKTVLHLQASEQRAREARAMLATGIEFSPRRRQDLDSVFLLTSSPQEARSLRPLLSFHYAGNLPVYAPSSVYSGSPDNRDRDLDGVQIAELPWLLGANPAARVALTAGSTGDEHYPRLHALGADAWLLQSRLAQLQAGPDALIRGNTGILSMDPELRVLREARPATFDGGDLQPR